MINNEWGEEMKNGLSLKLLELRQSHGLSQKELCKDLNISRTSYSYFENGRRYPDVSTLLLIAQYYKVSLDELVTGSCPTADNIIGDTILDSGVALARYLQSKHIPIESVMELSKGDFDFLMIYKQLSKDDQSELSYLANYKLRKQMK